MVQKELGMLLKEKYYGMRSIKNIAYHAGPYLIVAVLLTSCICKINAPTSFIKTLKALTKHHIENLILKTIILL